MKMMKNWIALLLALCMMAALGVASACCTEPTGMEEPQTMEETCACMMDGKGVDGCECMRWHVRGQVHEDLRRRHAKLRLKSGWICWLPR